jgi:hypothetical protein
MKLRGRAADHRREFVLARHGLRVPWWLATMNRGYSVGSTTATL